MKLIKQLVEIFLAFIITCVIFLVLNYVNLKFNIIKDYKKEEIKDISSIINPYMVNIKGSMVDENSINYIKGNGLSYESLNFDSVIYPYYSMLNDREKNLYKELYVNINNYVSNFNPTNSINVDEAQNAMEAIYNDHPEFFWLDSTFSYKYTTDNKCVQINLFYNSLLNNINDNKILFDEVVQEIISSVSQYSDSYNKEKVVHDILVNRIDYDINSENNQSAFSALVNKKSVCAGYARAFQHIMNKLNIPTFYVTGHTTKEAHAWNIVLLDNEYYNVDLTWSDSTKSYDYFNKSDSIFKTNHTRDGLSTNLPNCNGQKYTLGNNYEEKNNKQNSSEGEVENKKYIIVNGQIIYIDSSFDITDNIIDENMLDEPDLDGDETISELLPE